MPTTDAGFRMIASERNNSCEMVVEDAERERSQRFINIACDPEFDTETSNFVPTCRREKTWRETAGTHENMGRGRMVYRDTGYSHSSSLVARYGSTQLIAALWVPNFLSLVSSQTHLSMNMVKLNLIPSKKLFYIYFFSFNSIRNFFKKKDEKKIGGYQIYLYRTPDQMLLGG